MAGWLLISATLTPARGAMSGSPNQSLASTGSQLTSTNAMVSTRNRGSIANAGASASRLYALSDDYTTRLGPVHLRLIPRFEVEYNSNVNFAASNPIADLILRPGLMLEFDWVVTKKNRLTLNLGLEYEKYLRSVDRDNNGFRIRPDTVLSYSLYTGDFVVTIYDRPSVEQEPSADPSLVNTAPYTRLYNTAGLSVVWDLNKLILSALLERQDVQTLNNNFSGLNSVSYVGQLSAVYLFTPTFSAGPFVLVSQTNYQQATLNDFTTFQLGVNATQILSRYTTLNVSGGLQIMDFQDTGTPTPGFQTTSVGTIDNVTGTAGGGNYFGPFFSVGISNRLNRHFTQQLSVSLQPQASSVSNYSQVFAVTYDLDWRMNSQVNAFLRLNLENGLVSGTVPSYQRAEIKTGLRGQLTPSIGWKMELGYMFEAQTEGQGNVTQTRCIVGLDYGF